MESSSIVDSYLHKKFKKQLSVEPKTHHQQQQQQQQHHNEINSSATGIVESGEEKRPPQLLLGECNKVVINNQSIDNNDSVPNQSTNQNSSSPALNLKSSISVEKCIANVQSSNSCISYVVSNNNRNAEQLRPSAANSFDTTTNKTEPVAAATATTSTTSSILENLSNKHNYVKDEDISSNIKDHHQQHHRSSNNEESERKEDSSQQPPPDKSSSSSSTGGKYVCHYCNLVCSKPSVLQKHIRAHTNERPYPCDSCGFSFKTRSNLYKHCRSRTHANRVMGNKAQEINNEPNAAEVPAPTIEPRSPQSNNEEDRSNLLQDLKAKPYKPRFHTAKQFFITKENIQEDQQRIEDKQHANSDLLSHHINEIISKNNSIVNSNDAYLLKKRPSDFILENNNEYPTRQRLDVLYNTDEPLNLTNKNRKRCMSEVMEPVVPKSLIKELLLKNLNSDMQCPHCKMIFQTVTELELHKLRSCKGFVKPGAKYSRSSSVNVASILTQNKNAFDNIPHLQNAIFPLKSPGPFLGKTRLIDSDKSKSFSFDDGLPVGFPTPNNSCTTTTSTTDRYLLSPLTIMSDRERRMPVKMFGGEVKITQTSGETKSYKIDNKDSDKYESFVDYGGKLSENRVVKSGLQSGGTVLTNKANYTKPESLGTNQDVIRVYENTSVSPSIEIPNLGKTKFNFDRTQEVERTEMALNSPMESAGFHNATLPYKYPNIVDFSQKAVKLLTPNLKQPNLAVPGLPVPNKFTFTNINEHKPIDIDNNKRIEPDLPQNLSKTITVKPPDHYPPTKVFQMRTSSPPVIYNPMNLIVNGKVVRYVPGIPGPVAAEEPINMAHSGILTTSRTSPRKPSPLTKTPSSDKEVMIVKESKPLYLPAESKSPLKPLKLDNLEIKTDFSLMKVGELKSPKTPNVEKSSPVKISETKRFARPNSLALKPTTASLKQHHGLTPTMFNQILISPDTPRVAKKYVQQFLHGNYFSYLGLKCSTKTVYCTLNKTQPFYVPHFKKLSMYSEWRQQDTKTDKRYVSAYDSRQKHQKYTTAGRTTADLVVHSSYKFVASEAASSPNGERSGDDQQRNSTILGGYECNEDYTYIRGRGRGRYVCDQCGIRCKKPSMLKKHIRTHSNVRPYTCNHCNFSFKTKGNLTKHMKSKAHTKNYAASGSSSSTQQSGTQSSDSDTDDSGMDSSDECTRREEHEAAYGLLSLSQKTTQNLPMSKERNNSPTSSVNSETPASVMDTEEIVYVYQNNYAKNKILDEKVPLNFSAPKHLDMVVNSEESTDAQNLTQFLGRTSANRPLTYPYTTVLPIDASQISPKISEMPAETSSKRMTPVMGDCDHVEAAEPKSIKQFHVIQRYALSPKVNKDPPRIVDSVGSSSSFHEKVLKSAKERTRVPNNENPSESKIVQNIQPPLLKVNDVLMGDNQQSDLRKRKGHYHEENFTKQKIQKNDEVMDLSMATEKHSESKYNGSPVPVVDADSIPNNRLANIAQLFKNISKHPKDDFVKQNELVNYKNDYNKSPSKNNGNLLILAPQSSDVNINYVIQETVNSESPSPYNKPIEYDNSAMETLADIATKQVKLEKNTLAKSVASEYLKIATKNEFPSGDPSRGDQSGFGPSTKEVNELIVKPEGNKSCHICGKSFSKSSQLRLHMNIHYLERPFRCHSCSVSFRTKGHLQKHERSASHHNKLSSSPALSSSEPRPFKCVDCNIAFRIHGHLAKHLRSKMHIMKLECLAKIPFGLYAELERSNSLLTEINTADGDQCLESLKTLAKKVFINDPNKLNQLNSAEIIDADS